MELHPTGARGHTHAANRVDRGDSGREAYTTIMDKFLAAIGISIALMAPATAAEIKFIGSDIINVSSNERILLLSLDTTRHTCRVSE